MAFHKTLEIIEELRCGKMVILADDESRENEGDLVLPTDFVTPNAINFMIKEARGLVCVALTEDQVKRLSLPFMVHQNVNFSPNKTAFTVSVEAAKGVSTGISTADRSHTIRVVSNPQSTARDIISPGHVFPIRAQNGGVLKRAGHTEAGVDFCRLAGLTPSAVICEITNKDGSMARVDALFRFAEKHHLKIGSIEDLIEHRLSHETLVQEKLRTPFNTSLGKDWTAFVFYDEINDREHFALVKGKIEREEPVLARVHSSCLSGDLFQDAILESGKALRRALQKIEEEKKGVVVYLRMQNVISKQLEFHRNQRGREKGGAAAVFPSDNRDYGVGAQILRALGVSKIRLLLARGGGKKAGLKGYGLSVVETVPL